VAAPERQAVADQLPDSELPDPLPMIPGSFRREQNVIILYGLSGESVSSISA
jgi:hypothetical protein